MTYTEKKDSIDPPLLGRLPILTPGKRGTLRHDGRGTRYRIGEIEVPDRRGERRVGQLAAEAGQFLEIGTVSPCDHVDRRQMRILGIELRAQLRQRIEG